MWYWSGLGDFCRRWRDALPFTVLDEKEYWRIGGGLLGWSVRYMAVLWDDGEYWWGIGQKLTFECVYENRATQRLVFRQPK